MAMVYYYFVIGCFYFVLKSDQNVQASDSLGCQTVIAGIKMNSEWKVFNSQKVISWQRKSDGSTAVKSCGFNCGSTANQVPLFGSVSRIQYTDPTTGVVYSNTLCLGCAGIEKVVTEFNYSMVIINKLKGVNTTYNGPCQDIPVYRCFCDAIFIK